MILAVCNGFSVARMVEAIDGKAHVRFHPHISKGLEPPFEQFKGSWASNPVVGRSYAVDAQLDIAARVCKNPGDLWFDQGSICENRNIEVSLLCVINYRW